MRDKFQDPRYASFHIVHGRAVGVHVSGFRRFAHAVGFGVAVGSVTVEMRCPPVSVLRIVAAGWRVCRWVVGCWGVAVFGVLVSAYAAAAGCWAASLFVGGFWRWRIGEGSWGEGGIGLVGASG